MLGWDLDTRIGQTILAMQSSKAVGGAGQCVQIPAAQKAGFGKDAELYEIDKILIDTG